MADQERWVGVLEVAAHLRVAKDSVYRWIDERGLPAHRVGRLFRFKLSENRRVGAPRQRAGKDSTLCPKPTLLENADESISTQDTFTQEGRE